MDLIREPILKYALWYTPISPYEYKSSYQIQKSMQPNSLYTIACRDQDRTLLAKKIVHTAEYI
jgi:hypothetical protein